MTNRKMVVADLAVARTLPIEEYLSFMGHEVIKRGERYVCLSPLTNEERPSFYIYPENKFYCFSTGTSGDIIDLVGYLEDLGTFDSIRRVLNLMEEEDFDEREFTPRAKPNPRF